MSGMTKGERDELRRVVRQDFKVLAEEIKVRASEMTASIEQEVARRFEPSEEAWRTAQRRIAEIVLDANEAISVACAEAMKTSDGYKCEFNPLTPPYMHLTPVKRQEMRRAATADLSSKVIAATARLHRDEADLLKKLAVGALQTEEARAFLAAIPSVAELVPQARLAELEAAFDFDGDPS